MRFLLPGEPVPSEPSALEQRCRELEQRCHALESKARSLDALSRLASSLLHLQTDIDDILWDVANGTVAHLGLEDCVIYLLDEERQHLIQRAAYGPKNPEAREILDPIRIPVGKGIVGTVAVTGRPELIADTRHDPRYIRDDQMRLSELAVPLFFREEVIGVLDSEHSREGFFTEEHLHLLTSIASMTASRISRALLDEQLQDVRRRTDSIIESALDAIITVDGKGRIIGFNRAAQIIFRCEPPAALLNPLSVFLPGYDVSHPPSGLLELTGIRAGGSRFPVEASVSHVPGRHEVLTTFILRDISERLRAQRQIEELNQGLEARISERTRELSQANEQSERLLLNVLPPPIAERLKRGEQTIAERFEDVTVLFADLVGFSRWAAPIAPEEVVEVLGHVFTVFDTLTERHGLEKIKTIGDAYMVVAGVPTPREDHREAMARMALDMLEAVARLKEAGMVLDVRVGMHSGPVVAGIIGTRKFAYDLWGDTVNMASRLESHGLSGRIQVSEPTYLALRERFGFEPRGEVDIKSIGPVRTWWLTGERSSR
ncbi:adenylate/guanylate cyclase domain-containing protein [Archangium violaceum]|uniref:adenylate/guanylate cyclase domain-containing protein n=1 Tax=Archangium violaceum TaxID=83451 RepID=UPI002B2BD680|nr:adenylate/guanylate cyclase domain-containing protein [Archangium gephyra]